MTISEAMKRSQDSGQSFSRPGSGWFRYQPDWRYKDLTADDLMADDWEMYTFPVEQRGNELPS